MNQIGLIIYRLLLLTVCLLYCGFANAFKVDGIEYSELYSSHYNYDDKLGIPQVEVARKNKASWKISIPEKFWGLTIVHAPYIKTKDYVGEREARMSKTIFSEGKEQPKEIQFRCNSKGHIIPYIDVEIQVSQLDYVKLGPLADKKSSFMAIEMMKKKYGVEFDVNDSEIRYRDY